jgi:hypothetical protein
MCVSLVAAQAHAASPRFGEFMLRRSESAGKRVFRM